MTRKNWEFWLLADGSYQILRITLSQGHTETVALRHYINVAITAEEHKAIVGEVLGGVGDGKIT